MIKSLITALALLIPAMPSLAAKQPDSSSQEVSAAADKTFYLMVEGVTQTASGRTNVSLSMGVMLPARMNGTPAQLRKSISEVTYPSMIDALNALSTYGWRLVECYTLESRSLISERWILSKDVEDVNQLLEGIVKQ